jgi:tetratricopeptide (TPR) repeat protein
MNGEEALALADALVLSKNGKHLDDLQRAILRGVCQGQKYLEIADSYGYTEGYVKDVGSRLWKLLAEVLGEPITKSNVRAALERQNSFTQHSAQPFTPSKAPAKNTMGPDHSNFLGRSGAMAHLNTLFAQGAKVIVIQGEGGLGKTTLAQKYLKSQACDLILELLMAKEPQNITAVESVVEEWLKKDFNEEPGREFGVTLARLKRQLNSRRVGILIDNLEPALDRHGKFIDPHHRYVELLRILADPAVQSITLVTSRDRLCESGIANNHYRLPGLNQLAWQQFFKSRNLDTNELTLNAMHKAYAGNAKAMGILCGSIQEDFEGDMISYWQANSRNLLAEIDVKNLVSSQFNRLQGLDPKAYRLLNRLSCYRYQDVPTVPIEGLLCLLWDVEEEQQRHIIESLRNRSLLESHKGKYWLHPMIRAEAIGRLRKSEEWKEVNQKAAEFWTDHVKTVVTIQDALQALEAYYHYLEIKDFEFASKVILTSRNNQWNQFLSLGSTLYRMGLLQPLLLAIHQIIDKVQSGFYLSELYNILGDLHWIIGNIHKGIEFQEKAIITANQCLQSTITVDSDRKSIYFLKMIEIDSLLSIGLYKIDLWELEESAILFERVILLAQHTEHYRWAEKAWVGLALVNSYRGLKGEAYSSIQIIYKAIIAAQSSLYTGSFAYFIQLLGQAFKNWGEIERAFEMQHRAISFAEESHFLQVKAKALNSLAEIYREQGTFEKSLPNHFAAIELLDDIGARCDLAEAYFQLGLTYQKLGEDAKRKMNFDTSIRLFAEMKALKQVDKVQNISF